MSSGYTGNRINALQLNGAGQLGTTMSAAVNTAESFSVSGWFCPTKAAAGGTTIQSLITQVADSGALGGALRLGPNGFQELDTWTTANALEQVQIQTPLVDNTWIFISAAYDKINRQLRINVNSRAFISNWTTATSTQNHLPSSTQPVRLGENFTGQILNPVMAQGVLTGKQFSDAQAKFTTVTQRVLK